MPLEEKHYILAGDGRYMGIVITHRGNFRNTERFFNRMSKFEITSLLNKYGERGVAVLSAATPQNTGKTSESWNYEVERTGSGYSIIWTNTNINDGVNIALILQLGHGTGTGGYVTGIDYINPSLGPVFDEIADEAWQEVTKV